MTPLRESQRCEKACHTHHEKCVGADARAQQLVQLRNEHQQDEGPLTEAARKDMKAQGASELWQLGFVELALATGRAPAREECDGYAYRAPWSKMVGGKAAIKFKAVTLDALLAKADKDRPDFTVAAVDSHFTDLSISLTEDSADAFACETSTRPPARAQ